jgi:hypothetical protein
MKVAKWSDGRPKVWFEIYVNQMEKDSAQTLQAAVRKALHGHCAAFEPSAISIYEVHSMGGWNTTKEDKVVKVFKVVKGKAVRRNFVKGW